MTRWTRALTNSTCISHCSGSSSQTPDWGSQNLQTFTRSWQTPGHDERAELAIIKHIKLKVEVLYRSRWCLYTFQACVSTAKSFLVLLLQGQQHLSHLKHVGHDGSFALDVDAAGAIILPDCRLAAGWSLQLTGALRDKIPITVFHTLVHCSWICSETNYKQTDLIVGRDEATLTVPLLWKWLQVLIKTEQQWGVRYDKWTRLHAETQWGKKWTLSFI